MEIKDYSRGVLQYIPFFYVIWSDDLLSYSEISVIKKAIEQDETLEKQDANYLLKYLDKKAPPAYQELKHWKKVISHSGIKLVESDTYPCKPSVQRPLPMSIYYIC